MQSKCVKCKSMVNEGTNVTHAGKMKFLCNYCFEKLDNAPDSNTKVSDFLIMNKKEWIDRNIKLAKERRDRGESVWI